MRWCPSWRKIILNEKVHRRGERWYRMRCYSILTKDDIEWEGVPFWRKVISNAKVLRPYERWYRMRRCFVLTKDDIEWEAAPSWQKVILNAKMLRHYERWYRMRRCSVLTKGYIEFEGAPSLQKIILNENVFRPDEIWYGMGKCSVLLLHARRFHNRPVNCGEAFQDLSNSPPHNYSTLTLIPCRLYRFLHTDCMNCMFIRRHTTVSNSFRGWIVLPTTWKGGPDCGIAMLNLTTWSPCRWKCS